MVGSTCYVLYIIWLYNENCYLYMNKFKSVRIQAQRNYYAAEICTHNDN